MEDNQSFKNREQWRTLVGLMSILRPLLEFEDGSQSYDFRNTEAWVEGLFWVMKHFYDGWSGRLVIARFLVWSPAWMLACGVINKKYKCSPFTILQDDKGLIYSLWGLTEWFEYEKDVNQMAFAVTRPQPSWTLGDWALYLHGWMHFM